MMLFKDLSVYGLFKVPNDKANRIFKKTYNKYDRDNSFIISSKYNKQCCIPIRIDENLEIIKVEV